MSRLTDLIANVKSKDPHLGSDLERHSPEAVELPQRQVRRKDKSTKELRLSPYCFPQY
ncbi:hypothetical protein [Pontibacter sp. 172403-2]|uniref:hypothetical protein n=1 Tax=Pontibacter rufus TaxID=2791028 RepID=UPI001E2C9F1C|nr:hypothetical protein [Pontibacter sp. 172403-2]